MGFFDWIRKGIENIGKSVNQAIAGFERTTGIDIPVVGTDLSKEKKTSPKPTQPQKPSLSQQKAIEEARKYFESGGTYKPSPFKTKSKPQPQSRIETPKKKYRVVLGTTAHKRQIKEIEEQIGSPVKVVTTPEGKIAVEFESEKPVESVKVTPLEVIRKEEEEKRKTELARKIYEKTSPLEKIGLHAHTLLSGSWADYLASWIPGGKKPEDVVVSRIKEMLPGEIEKEHKIRIPVVSDISQLITGKPVEVGMKDQIGYVVESMVEQPGTEFGAWYLTGAGVGAVGGIASKSTKVASVVSKVGGVVSKVPGSRIITKITKPVVSTMVKHPRATAVALVGGTEAVKGGLMYKELKAKGVPDVEIAEQITSSVSKDLLDIAGFGLGLKHGLESTLKTTKTYEIVGRKTKEGTMRLVVGEEEGLEGVEGKILKRFTKTEKWIEPMPREEWMKAIKHGKVIKETPDYIIKEYKGYEYLISKHPTGLPTKKLDELGLIDILRVEKKDYLKLGVIKSGKYKGMEVFVRKGVGIPVEISTPEEVSGWRPTVFKGKGSKSDVLKDLAEYYRQQKLAEDLELAKKITEAQNQQLRAMEEASKQILGMSDEGISGAKEVTTSSGSLLMEPPKETGFVKLEPVAYPGSQIPEEVLTPFAIEFTETVKPTIPFIPAPVITTPTPKTTQKLEPELLTAQKIEPKTTQRQRQKQRQREKVEEKKRGEEKPFIPSPVPVEVITPKQREDLFTPLPTDTFLPPTEKITPKETLIPEEVPIETIPGIPGLPLPLLFPERPKGGVGKFKIKETEIFGFETKYEPSLLGILLGKKRKKRKVDLFTGFEIRGI